jgi:hypothetical protein
MEITHEQYEAALRHAKAEVLRDAASRISAYDFGWKAAPYLATVVAGLRADADELESQ